MKATLGGFPTIVPATVLGQDAPSNKLTIGFFGTGNNGTNWMRRFLPDSRMRVLAVRDVNREDGYWDGTIRGREPARRSVNEYYGDDLCLALEDFRAVIRRDDIDSIYIATPDHWHALVIIAAARAAMTSTARSLSR